jgi:hypothetical protein
MCVSPSKTVWILNLDQYPYKTYNYNNFGNYVVPLVFQSHEKHIFKDFMSNP